MIGFEGLSLNSTPNTQRPSKPFISLGAVILWCLVAGPAASAEWPFAFDAEYSVEARSMSVGTATFSLQPAQNQQWRFYSSTKPSSWVKMLTGQREDKEESLLSIEKGKVLPLHYAYSNPSEDKGRRYAQIEFDWYSKTAKLDQEGKQSQIPLTGLSFDRLSVNLAISQLIQTHPKGAELKVLGPRGERITPTKIEAHPKLRVPAGTYDVVKVTRQRGRRSMVSWHAQALSYLPVQLEQYKDNKLQARMKLKKLKR